MVAKLQARFGFRILTLYLSYISVHSLSVYPYDKSCVKAEVSGRRCSSDHQLAGWLSSSRNMANFIAQLTLGRLEVNGVMAAVNPSHIS